HPPQTKGFVPLKWRWISERGIGMFNFFRRLDKDHEKTTNSVELGFCGTMARLI
ncbi:MAG: hypothetical protein JWQ14_988, partial [Adhaeribacter sp.]|nr:hypothetical protein [Adhaeribacter sp.]